MPNCVGFVYSHDNEGQVRWSLRSLVVTAAVPRQLALAFTA